MPRAELTITLPESVWIGRLSRSHPEVTFRILSAFGSDGDGVGLLEVVGPDLERVLAGMYGAESVTELDVLELRESRALVRFETTHPLLLLPLRSSGVPLELPFEILDGRSTWELTAPRERLSALCEQLDAFDIRYSVDRIHGRVVTERLLTDRQRELVETAVEQGYYDTPRTCSLTELAGEMGLAKSTCSETLHRAEGKIIRRFVEGGDGEPRLGVGATGDATASGGE